MTKTLKTITGKLTLCIPENLNEVTLGQMIHMQSAEKLSDLQAISMLSGTPLEALQNIVDANDLYVFSTQVEHIAYQIKHLYNNDAIPKTISFIIDGKSVTVKVIKNLSIEPAGAFMASKEIIADEITRHITLHGEADWQQHFNPSLSACAQILAQYFYCRATGQPYNENAATEFEDQVKQLPVTDALPIALNDTNLIRKSILDTIMKRVNIKNAKDILEVTQLNERLLVENAKLKKDTGIKGKAILYYRDKWLDASVNLVDSTFNLSYNAQITTTKFNRWKFSPLPSRVAVYDFYGDDPRMNITGAKHLLIEQSDPLLGFKVQARTSYDIHSGKLIPSAGLEVRLGPVDVAGRYYYSYLQRRWQPIVSGTVNLLNIH